MLKTTNGQIKKALAAKPFSSKKTDRKLRSFGALKRPAFNLRHLVSSMSAIQV